MGESFLRHEVTHEDSIGRSSYYHGPVRGMLAERSRSVAAALVASSGAPTFSGGALIGSSRALVVNGGALVVSRGAGGSRASVRARGRHPCACSGKAARARAGEVS